MQVIIEIPESEIPKQQDIIEIPIHFIHGTVCEAGGYGFDVLPKGHGRLIDADELYGDFIDGTEGYDCQTWNRIEIGDIIDDAPTIIEADKAKSEDTE